MASLEEVAPRRESETYEEWLARMWRVAEGIEQLSPEEQMAVGNHVINHTEPKLWEEAVRKHDEMRREPL